MKRFLHWVNHRLPLRDIWRNHFSEYYLPKNLNFFYVFGVLALVMLVNQFLSGLWLTMFYTPNVEQAFSSIEYIMRDVHYGWLFRYMHSTGASAFFIVIYLHIYRGLLYGSYQQPRELVWVLGMLLYVILLVEAFFGYLLPWGQMSYWGAEVITSLFGVMPWIGKALVVWIRGDYSVANATLQRFFALHVIGVTVVLGLFAWLHLVALRQVGSNNPEGIEIKNQSDSKGRPLDKLPFYPYYIVKDFFAVVFFLTLFFLVVFFFPEMGGYFLERANFTPANPLMTPELIVPAWYMAPFYAILRAIPDRALGIGAAMAAIVLLFILPWLDKSPVRSMRYKGACSRFMLVLFVMSFLFLGYLGTEPISDIRLFMARISIVFYFAYFLFMPFYTRFEACKKPPERITR